MNSPPISMPPVPTPPVPTPPISTPSHQADKYANSVGIVTPQRMHFDTPLLLECQRTLSQFELVYETYGVLNSDGSNAVLICHALSGSHHAAGYHSLEDKKAGWWDNMIGPNKAIDSNRFFVVCLNNIGSCHGSTGPTSINPDSPTGAPYGPDFPLITIKDWVHTQALLSDRLGIAVWHAIVGGSMGGMQALQWAVDYPHRLKRSVIIASTPKLSAQNIAFNEVARQSILSDPDFKAGRYLEAGTYPRRGLILARMVGHITYLTDAAMKSKFGRDLKSGKFMYGYDVEFQVESYLRYQGERFSENFDANTYLLMTKALDYFDPTRDYVADIDVDVNVDDDNSRVVDSMDNSRIDDDSERVNDSLDNDSLDNDSLDNDGFVDNGMEDLEALKLTFAHTSCQFLVISFTTDWRFAPARSQEIVDALMATDKAVSYVNIDAPHGHDSFLFHIPRYLAAVKGFLNAPFLGRPDSQETPVCE